MIKTCSDCGRQFYIFFRCGKPVGGIEYGRHVLLTHGGNRQSGLGWQIQKDIRRLGRIEAEGHAHFIEKAAMCSVSRVIQVMREEVSHGRQEEALQEGERQAKVVR